MIQISLPKPCGALLNSHLSKSVVKSERLKQQNENIVTTRMALSRAHTSAKSQQSPLIQSSLIQYQTNHV